MILLYIFYIVFILIIILLYFKKPKKFKHNEKDKKKIQDNISLSKKIFSQYPSSDEIPERISVYNYIDKNDKVLEIGGNIGGVSCIIADKLINSKNLVVIEPSKEAFIKLKNLSEKYNFNIHNGPIIKKNSYLECKLVTNDNHNYYNCEKVNYKVENNITFKELQKKFNIIFNTLVIDCEGCYEDIFEDAFETGWIKQIKKIIIEWDGNYLENKILNNGFTLVSYLPHESVEHGVKVYIRKF